MCVLILFFYFLLCVLILFFLLTPMASETINSANPVWGGSLTVLRYGNTCKWICFSSQIKQNKSQFSFFFRYQTKVRFYTKWKIINTIILVKFENNPKSASLLPLLQQRIKIYKYRLGAHWNNCHRPWDKLTPLGAMAAQLRAPPKPPPPRYHNIISCVRGVSGAP